MAYPTKEILLKDLLDHQDENVQIEVVIISADCCTECAKKDGQILDIDTAIKFQILPNEKCIRANGCVCCYGYQGKRDANGRLIRKKDG